MNDPYFGFVFSAYAISALTIGGLVAWVVIERRGARAALQRADRAARRARRGGA